MKSKRKLTDDQIKTMLAAHNAGVRARILMRKYEISDATFYTYKKKYNPLLKSPKPIGKYFKVPGAVITYKAPPQVKTEIQPQIKQDEAELLRLKNVINAYQLLHVESKEIFDMFYELYNK